MAGLYDNTRVVPDRHWRREEDNYLIQQGVMHRIMQDPYARKGLEARRPTPDSTINMGGDPERLMGSRVYGLYSYYPNRYPPDQRGLKTDGELLVDVDRPTSDWNETLVHELGHVGSRNSMSDTEARLANEDTGPTGEEARQRLADLAIHPEDSAIARDARMVMRNQYGWTDQEINIRLEAYRRQMGIGTDTQQASAPPKPRLRPQKEAKAAKAPKRKKKKKTLVDILGEAGWTLTD